MGHQVLLRERSLRGNGEKGGLRRAAPTRSVHSSRSSSQAAAAAPLAHVVLDLRARRRRRASVSSIKWDAHVRANAGQGWRMGSSSSMAAAPASGREQAVRGRGAPSGGERERIARRERCGRVGFRVQYASRGSRRVACGFIGGAVRRGKRERQRKVQNCLDGAVRQSRQLGRPKWGWECSTPPGTKHP